VSAADDERRAAKLKELALAMSEDIADAVAIGVGMLVMLAEDTRHSQQVLRVAVESLAIALTKYEDPSTLEAEPPS